MTSYMIALFSPQEMNATYVKIAQTFFSTSWNGFLLSQERQPHVTIVQFRCESPILAQSIGRELANVLPCSIRFTGMSFIQGIGEHKGFYWAELSVAREEALMNLHRKAISLVRQQGLSILNETEDLYRPHLTLARLKLPPSLPSWPEAILQHPLPFTVAFTPCLEDIS